MIGQSAAGQGHEIFNLTEKVIIIINIIIIITRIIILSLLLVFIFHYPIQLYSVTRDKTFNVLFFINFCQFKINLSKSRILIVNFIIRSCSTSRRLGWSSWRWLTSSPLAFPGEIFKSILLSTESLSLISRLVKVKIGKGRIQILWCL